MNNFLIRIKHIVPFVMVRMLAIVIGYGVVRWFVTVILEIDVVKHEVWHIYIPILLFLVIVILPFKRINIIKEPETKNGWRTFIAAIIYIMTFVMLSFSQLYIENKFSKRIHVHNITEIASTKQGNYFQITEIKVNDTVFGNYFENRSLYHRGKETMTFNLYLVYPLYGNENYWYALKFSERFNHTFMSDEQTDRKYYNFIEECKAKILIYDFKMCHTFKKIPPSGEKDGFTEALKKLQVTDKLVVNVKEAFFLQPLPDGIEDKSNNSLEIVFLAFGIGMVLLLIALAFSKNNTKVIYKNGKLKKQKKNDEGWLILKDFTIPDRDNWLLAVIVDTIVVLFLVMTLCGVNIFSPAGKELLEWGALSRQGLVQGEWWILFLHIFIHAGLPHFIFNIVGLGLALIYIIVLFSRHKIAIIFLISGVFGGVVSLLSYDSLCVGASGAIMGLFGAVLSVYFCYSQVKKSIFPILPLLLIVGGTLLFGLMPSINNTAHITGLLTGGIIGLLFFKQPPLKK